MKYWAKVMGQVKLDDGTIPGCPQCGETRGLVLTTLTSDRSGVHAECPKGHQWRDRRIPQDLVIFAATAGH